MAELQTLLQRGLALHRQGRLAEAEACYRQILQSAPGAPEALNLLGALLAQLGGAKLAEGIACLQQAVAAAPQRGDIQLNLAQALRLAGETEAALDAVRTARGTLPAQAQEQALLAEGSLLEALGRSAEAIALYEAAPRSPGLLFALAAALNAAGRLDAAEDALTEALAQAPGFAQAHGNLAGIRLKRGKLDPAIASYHQGLAAAPQEPLLHLGLGNALYRAKDYAGAAEAFRAALALKGDLADGHAGLVNALAKGGKTGEALAAAEAAAALPAPPPRLLSELSGILAGLDRKAEALAAAEQALAAAPHEIRALSRLAPLLRAAGRAEEAAALFSPGRVLRSRLLSAPPPGWDSLAAFNRDLAAHIRARPDHTAEAPDAATKGGSQTAELFGDPAPVVQALKTLLEAEVRAALGAYTTAPPAPYFAAPPQSWRLISNAVVLQAAGYQDPHVHINGYLSGVYYLEIPEEVSRGNGEEGCLYLADSQAEEARSLREIVRPQEGLVVLFPSYLWHGTVPYHSDKERICVAFDLVPEGAGEVRVAEV
ncbi:MAG: tetratricopeptide repeat protein [Rhodovibrionaceae bacterium]